MLQTYAKAVKQMNASPENSPTGWLFQWYTHAIKSERGVTKESELKRVFGDAPSAAKDLATEMWNTCQPHHAGGQEEYFLPWHRMFVYYFESIVRSVSGDSQFALPYWNYSAQGPDHGIIPPEFRDTARSTGQSATRARTTESQ